MSVGGLLFFFFWEWGEEEGEVYLPGSANEFPFGALFDELLGCQLIAIEDTKDVDVHHAFHIFFRQLQGRLHLCDAGVGDHDAQGSESLDGCLDQGVDFCAFGDVGGDADGVAVLLGFYLVDDVGDEGLVCGDVVDANVEAFVGEPEGDCFAAGERDCEYGTRKGAELECREIFSHATT